MPSTEPALSAASTPPITATVSTIQGWPEIEHAITSVAASIRRAGGELIVTDGSSNPPPPAGTFGPETTWLSFPGESTYQMRARAYDLARGDVVAITEDHVNVPVDWAEKHVRAHREHPEADAIGGSVENGATRHVLDWASFLLVQAAVAAPIRTGPARRLSGAVNVSYKRAALRDMDRFDGLGMIDGIHQKQLASRGANLRNDDSIRVFHDQSLGFRGFTAIHYHSGRTISGFKRQHFGPVDLARVIGAPLVPMARYARLAYLLGRRGHGRLVMRYTPAILYLLYAQGLGQLIGYLRGPGRSPYLVQ